MSRRPVFTPHTHARRSEFIEHFMSVLRAEQDRRGERGEFVDGELEWVTKEREALVREVAIQRPDLPLDVIEREVRAAEGLAEGHSDYTFKFALGCANIIWLSVLGEDARSI